MNTKPDMRYVSNKQGLTLEEKARVDEEGFYVKRSFYSATQVANILEVFGEASKNGPVPGLSDVPKNALDPDDPLAFYPRMMNPHRRQDKTVGKVASDYLLDPRLEPILKDLIDDEPIGAQTMFYFKPPGARGQALHQDNFFLRVKPGTCMAAWLALDVTNADNGAMMVVPGSHKDEVVCPEEADLRESFTPSFVPVPKGKEAVTVDMQPGDVLFFNGSVIHGSLPNKNT